MLERDTIILIHFGVIPWPATRARMRSPPLPQLNEDLRAISFFGQHLLRKNTKKLDGVTFVYLAYLHTLMQFDA